MIDGRATGMVALLGNAPGFVLEASSHSRLRLREVHLRCLYGTAWLRDSESNELEVWPDGAETLERRPLPAERPQRREIRVFLDYLGGGPPPPTTAREGALIVRRVAELRRLAGLET